MDRSVFHRITGAVARRRTRRNAIKTGLGGLAALAGARNVAFTAAQDATPETTGSDEKAYFLFAQTASSGSFTPNPNAGTPIADGTPTAGGGGEYLLTLEGHVGDTVYFSDRPERIFGIAPTEEFLEGLGFTPLNPPNAALVTHSPDGDDIVVVVELIEPFFDAESQTITYGATILAEYEGEGLDHLVGQGVVTEPPEYFDSASLFIDDCPNSNTCFWDDGFSVHVVGRIPGGPYGHCWDWGCLCCPLCRESERHLADLCNAAYSSCRGDCFAGSLNLQ